MTGDRFPDARLMTSRTKVRHYVIQAVPVGDIGSEHCYWCRIPDGWVMCRWDIQPAQTPKVPLCPTCLVHANAIGSKEQKRESA